jgi:hypothetical protein
MRAPARRAGHRFKRVPAARRRTVDKQSLHVEARRRAAVDKRGHHQLIDGGRRSSNSVDVRKMTAACDDSHFGMTAIWDSRGTESRQSLLW